MWILFWLFWFAVGRVSYLVIRAQTRARRGVWMLGDQVIGNALAILFPPLLVVIALWMGMEARPRKQAPRW